MFERWVCCGVAAAVLLTGAPALVRLPAMAQRAPSASVPVPPPAASIAPVTTAPPVPGAAAAAQPPSRPFVAAETAVDQHILRLRTQLGITTAQSPLWSAFAHAMREDAQTTGALLAQRAAAVASMSAVDNMTSYARIVHIYAADTERLAHAFDRLYAGLSPAQRRTADGIFRRQGRGTGAGR